MKKWCNYDFGHYMNSQLLSSKLLFSGAVGQVLRALNWIYLLLMRNFYCGSPSFLRIHRDIASCISYLLSHRLNASRVSNVK